MAQLIKRLLHAHQWRTVKTVEADICYNGRVEGTQYIYIQECAECGKMRKFIFKTD